MAWTVADNQTCKVWAKETYWTFVKKSFFFPRFVGEGTDNIVQQKTELKKNPGDRLYYHFTDELAQDATGRADQDSYGEGINNIGTLMGNEKDIIYYGDSVTIGQKRQGIRHPGEWFDQQVSQNVRKDMKERLGRWAAKFHDMMFINHMCGVTSWLWPETAVAPTADADFTKNRHIYGGNASSTATIEYDDYFTASEIDKQKAMADVADPIIEPINIEGGQYYVLILHPYSAYTLRQDTDWQNAHYYAHERGLKNPIFDGSLGIYNGVVVYQHPWMPHYTNGGSHGNKPWARNLFMGRFAGMFAKAREWVWKEDTTSTNADYGDKPAFSIKFMNGFKKVQYGGESKIDYSTIVCDAYAPVPGTAYTES